MKNKPVNLTALRGSAGLWKAITHKNGRKMFSLAKQSSFLLRKDVLKACGVEVEG